MRCENKPLLQDHAGFLQEITPITVEVGLAPEHTRVELSDNPGKHGVNIATLALSRRKAQRGAEAVSPGCLDAGVSASILDPIRAITEAKLLRLGRASRSVRIRPIENSQNCAVPFVELLGF